MKRRDLVDILKTTGIPVAYYQWEETDDKGPDLPYLVYYFPSAEPEAADDRVWAQIMRLNVELYTDTKDFETEALVDALMSKIGVFTKEETYINDEHMYEVLYMTEVLIDG